MFKSNKRFRTDEVSLSLDGLSHGLYKVEGSVLDCIIISILLIELQFRLYYKKFFAAL